MAGADPAFHDRKPESTASAEFAAWDSTLETCVRQIANGAQQGLAALYDRTSSLVYSVALQILRDPADAEEVTLDVYLQVWRSAAKFDPARASVSTWLVMLARSRAVDRLRSGMTRKSRESALEGVADPASGEAAPDQQTILKLEQRRVRAAMATLEPEQRRTIELAFFGGLTHSELAKKLGQPLGTVKTRIRLGLMKLRQALSGAEG